VVVDAQYRDEVARIRSADHVFNPIHSIPLTPWR
jgi:hypothetical protein